MNALAQLLRYYNGNLDAFYSHARFYGSTGICHLSPDVCLMARPVDPDWHDPLIIGLHPLAHNSDLTHSPRAVHVHIATGNLEAVRRLLIPRFGRSSLLTYQRRGGPLRRVPVDQINRFTHGIRRTRPPTQALAANARSEG